MHHGPLDVVLVGVVLQSSLQQPRLLAQLGNMGAIIVGEHLVAQDRICYLKKKKKHAFKSDTAKGEAALI